MRILVDNSGYELLNLGDVAMLEVAISRLRALWLDARITVITTAPRLLAKYCPATIPLSPEGRDLWLRKSDLFGSLHRLIPAASHGLFALEARFRRRFPSIMRTLADERLRTRGCDTRPMVDFLDAVFCADLVVGTGGGYLTDAFAEHAMDILETLHLAQSLGIPTALLGQGLGPVSQSRVWNPMQRVLPRVDLIGLREGLASYDLALRLGVPRGRIHVTGDDALPLAAAKSSTSPRHIGVNLRTAWYAAVPERATDALHRAVGTLSRNHAASVIPLPVSSHDRGEDSRAVERLIGDRSTNQQIDSPQELIDRIATCRLVITGSYHAAVFALAQGVGVIGLVGSRYYADKFAGLAHQFHNIGCMIATLDQPDLEQKLVASGERLLREGPHVQATLLECARQQVKAGESVYQRLATIVMERRLHNGHAHAARVGADSGL